MKNKHAQLKLFTLFSLLLLFCTFESMAQEKLITINVKNVSLKEIFNIIENQTPYRFSYRSVVLDADRNISISAENISVTTVLNQALKDRNLEYSIVSPKTIVISDKQTGNVKSSETKKISGIIKDVNGEPIIGANVKIKGQSIGTITDIDGRFVLDASTDATLQISYIGYASLEMNTGNKKELNIVLKEDTDYKITYSNNINPGTAKVEITGLGDYKGCSLSYTYTIHKTETPVKPSEDTNPSHNDSTTETKKESLTIATDPENAIYNGKNITRKVIVRSGNEVLTEGRDYKITYSNNKNCGIVTMKIIGIGNHQGTITKTFKIAPKKASLKKIKSGKKTATLYIRKSSGGVTGYQIRYSYKKNFKSSKYKGSKKTTYKIKGLKRKKQVYVKIRAYKQVGKAKIYGSWSNSKKVKIK